MDSYGWHLLCYLPAFAEMTYSPGRSKYFHLPHGSLFQISVCQKLLYHKLSGLASGHFPLFDTPVPAFLSAGLLESVVPAAVSSPVPVLLSPDILRFFACFDVTAFLGLPWILSELFYQRYFSFCTYPTCVFPLLAA